MKFIKFNEFMRYLSLILIINNITLSTQKSIMVEITVQKVSKFETYDKFWAMPKINSFPLVYGSINIKKLTQDNKYLTIKIDTKKTIIENLGYPTYEKNLKAIMEDNDNSNEEALKENDEMIVMNPEEASIEDEEIAMKPGDENLKENKEIAMMPRGKDKKEYESSGILNLSEEENDKIASVNFSKESLKTDEEIPIGKILSAITSDEILKMSLKESEEIASGNILVEILKPYIDQKLFSESKNSITFHCIHRIRGSSPEYGIRTMIFKYQNYFPTLKGCYPDFLLVGIKIISESEVNLIESENLLKLLYSYIIRDKVEVTKNFTDNEVNEISKQYTLMTGKQASCSVEIVRPSKTLEDIIIEMKEFKEGLKTASSPIYNPGESNYLKKWLSSLSKKQLKKYKISLSEKSNPEERAIDLEQDSKEKEGHSSFKGWKMFQRKNYKSLKSNKKTASPMEEPEMSISLRPTETKVLPGNTVTRPHKIVNKNFDLNNNHLSKKDLKHNFNNEITQLTTLTQKEENNPSKKVSTGLVKRDRFYKHERKNKKT
jgi:hypothetical protein